MPEILDQRNITFEQSRKASLAFVTVKVVEDVVDVVYAAGRGEETYEVDAQGWKLALEYKESCARVVVRTTEELLLEPVRNVLRVFYTVNSMRDNQGDYLVVLI